MMVLGSVAVVSTADPEDEFDESASSDADQSIDPALNNAGSAQSGPGSLFAQMGIINAPGLISDGTAEDDAIAGTDATDLLNGRGGGDTLSGAGGDDQIHGGTGGDAILGGAGQDSLHGEADDDTLRGGNRLLSSP